MNTGTLTAREIQVSVFQSGYECISLLCHLREPRNNDTPVAQSTPRTQTLISKLFSNKRIQSSLEKCLILGLGQKICKISLECVTVTESKKEPEDENTQTCPFSVIIEKWMKHTHTTWRWVKGSQKPMKTSETWSKPVTKPTWATKLIDQTYYSPMYKINIP